MRQDGHKKVRVRVPITRDVYYVVEVDDPTNIDEVSMSLARKDPSQWECDPSFYEHLGDVWKQVVHDIKREDIEGLWDNIPLNPFPWPMRCYVI